MKTFIYFVLALIPSVVFAEPDKKTPRFRLEVEGGLLYQTRNEVQIPNEESATRIDLTEMIGMGPLPAGRVYFTWNINDRHAVRALFAPLQVTRSKTIDSAILFDGVTFDAGQKTAFTYKFNSYRLNYHYRFFAADTFKAFVGFTAKIRDAKVELTQGDHHGVLTDLGFVPLLYLAFDWRFAPRTHLVFDFNGLAGGPGRAFDVSLKVAYDITDNLGVSVGYRTVEGGADVDAVYNFAWLHFGVLSLSYQF
ncbi:hypothetical protein KKF84_00595 [Myxococcota bacterium]|nr:hypothetical protein [Myxococcota bacterium]MBU1533783.1 hypothetical protein [Myxococcota bacterium]